MLSFTNTIETKEQAVANAKRHYEQDMLLKGSYGKGAGDAFRGCSVGCFYKPYEGKVEAPNLHALSEPVHGIPEWFTRLRDTLFEGVSEQRRNRLHVELTEATPVGLSEEDFEKYVKAPFMIIVLESTLPTFDHAKFPDVKAAVDGSIALWKRDDIGSDDWEAEAVAAVAAAKAAKAAAWAASAAWAAANAAANAAAEAAVLEAEAAANAAAAADWAEVADWAKAEAAKYDYFADELLRILDEAKEKKGA